MDNADIKDIRWRAKALAASDREHMRTLVKLRRKAKATQADIAELLGVPIGWVTDIEAYDSDPRLSDLRRYQNIVTQLYEASDG
jgi:predicted transcriptional regulator